MSRTSAKDWYERIPYKGACEDWNDLLDIVSKQNWKPHQWAYRGQSDDNWTLTTSLERVTSLRSEGLKVAAGIELRLVREFMRRSHHYISSLPAKSDIIEWLALMQHHGSPTRLLDWTYSFYVALHFALSQPSKSVAIWAIDISWIRDQVLTLLPKNLSTLWRNPHGRKDNKIILKVLSAREKFVLCVTPFRMNERLTVQQGTFLMPRDVTAPFEGNLRNMAMPSQLRKHVKKIVVNLSPKFRSKIFQELEAMNIGEANLFPGIDGFSRSLARQAQLFRFDVFGSKESVVKWISRN